MKIGSAKAREGPDRKSPCRLPAVGHSGRTAIVRFFWETTDTSVPAAIDTSAVAVHSASPMRAIW